MGRYYFDTRETRAYHLEPLHIKVLGDVAIIHYVGSWVQVGPGGEEVSVWKWTDIMVNEGGKWMWIADHVGPIEDPGSQD